MYYRAREKALANGHKYHLAAILRRKGRVVRIGINSNKTHPNYDKHYPDGTVIYRTHAEMDALRDAQPGDCLEVFRVKSSDGEYAMAKPCKHCMIRMQKAGIKRLSYTDHDGVWRSINLRKMITVEKT